MSMTRFMVERPLRTGPRDPAAGPSETSPRRLRPLWPAVMGWPAGESAQRRLSRRGRRRSRPCRCIVLGRQAV